MDEDFRFSILTERIIRFWWVIALLIITGGILGMVVTRLHKPVYESHAAITTSIDYAYAGKIFDTEEDQVISVIGDVIGSSQVIDELTSGISESQLPIKAEQISSMISKSRQGFRWVLTTRSNNPEIAQKINQLWLNSAMKALGNLRQHSIEIFHNQVQQTALETCLSETVNLDPSSSVCSLDQLAAIRAVAQKGPDEKTTYTLGEMIVLSKVSFEVTQEADLPTTQVLFKQNLNVLIGMVLGLLIGIGYLVIRKNPS